VLIVIGALTYLPLFQQVVRGLSPTASGLQLVPLMIGLLAASIGSVGLLLLSRLEPGTGSFEAALYMLVSRRRPRLRNAGARTGGPERRALLTARRRHLLGDPVPLYVHSFTDSISTVFLIAAAVVTVAFLLAWMLEERPLRKTIEDSGVGDAFAPPQDTDSLREITRELSRLVGRERTRRFIEGVIEEAEVELTPAEVWLLGRAVGGATHRRGPDRPRAAARRPPAQPHHPCRRLGIRGARARRDDCPAVGRAGEMSHG
jgi:hypothetical protein